MTTEPWIIEFLKALHACPEGVAWARGIGTPEGLWRDCPHAQWMIWYLEQIGYEDVRLRLFAGACARHHEHLLVDPRSRRAVDVAERFAAGLLGTDELRRARGGAQAAVDEGTLRREWTAALAAAAMTCYEGTRSTGLAAARGASKYGIRAAAWDLGTNVTPDLEDFWQCDQLRAFLGPNFPRILELARGMGRID